jgi:thiol-disulfide isomerase/thioredoxin
MVYLEDVEACCDVDSTYIVGNRFQFKGHVKGFKDYAIHTKNYEQDRYVWVENTKMLFDARNTSFQKAKVTGSRIQMQDDVFEKATAPLYDSIASIKNIRRQVSKLDTQKWNALTIEMQKYKKKKLEVEIDLIKKHPDYELASWVLSFLLKDISLEQARSLYLGLDEKVRNNTWGKKIEIYLNQSVDLKPGDRAIDFCMKNLNGENISLSDFEGKYVLLEFTSSGCRACIEEKPWLRKAYRKYHSKGFDILEVNLDRNGKHWENGMQRDSVVWTSVSDLKGLDGRIPIIYRVASIPVNYLLDPKGKVISKELRGDRLLEELHEIYGE